MKTKMFRKILGLEVDIPYYSILKQEEIRKNEGMIIPREYLIEVITTIPERRVVIEYLDIYKE